MPHAPLRRLATRTLALSALAASLVHCGPECKEQLSAPSTVGWRDLMGNFTAVQDGETMTGFYGFQGGQHVEVGVRFDAPPITDPTHLRVRFVRPADDAVIATRETEVTGWDSVIGVPGQRELALRVFLERNQVAAVADSRVMVDVRDEQGRCLHAEVDVHVMLTTQR